MSFIGDFITGRLRQAVELCTDLIKLKLATAYVNVIEHVRHAFNSMVVAVAGTMLAVMGFLILHVGLFLVLPWSPATKGYILLGLGLVYIVVPLIIVQRLGSHATWMRLSGADELVDRVAKKH